MLTDKQKQAYLKASHKCPYCKGPDIEGGSYDHEGDHLYQDVKCLACGRTWTDEYTLTGLLEVPEEGADDPRGEAPEEVETP